MRPFLFFVILAALAVAAAIGLRVDPGNVVLFYPPYRVDLSLNLFIILAVLLFVALYVLVRLARKTLRMPERVAEYRSRQAERRGTRALRNVAAGAVRRTLWSGRASCAGSARLA